MTKGPFKCPKPRTEPKLSGRRHTSAEKVESGTHRLTWWQAPHRVQKLQGLPELLECQLSNIFGSGGRGVLQSKVLKLRHKPQINHKPTNQFLMTRGAGLQWLALKDTADLAD